MIFHPSYVLLLSQYGDELQSVKSLLERLKLTVRTADSIEQAIAHIHHSPPGLVIVQSNDWSVPLLHEIRATANADSTTLVVLTECHTPRWQLQEQNPGFDGFLVKPLSLDILSSLVQSAFARQQCLAH